MTPLTTVTVVSQLSGYLTQVAFTEGQHVKKGDFLAQIDPRPYEALKAQYEGQLAHDQGLLDQAQLDDARYNTLLKQNSIAAQTAQDQKFIVAQYQGSVRSDQAQIDAQTLNLAYAHIVSPARRADRPATGRSRQLRSGRVCDRHGGHHPDAADVGDLHRAGGFSGRNPAEYPRGRQAGRDGLRPRQCQATGCRNGGGARQPDRHDDRHGQIARAVRQCRRGAFPQPVRQYPPDRRYDARTRSPRRSPAIQHGAPGDYAYVVKDGKASVHVVKLGKTDGPYVQILSGLSAGDQVVVDGADRLRDGAEVRIVTENAQGKSTKDKATPGQSTQGDKPQGGKGGRCGVSIRRAAADRRQGARRMNVSEPFIRRPVATSLLMVAILLSGLMGYRLLPLGDPADGGLSHHPGPDFLSRRQPGGDDLLGDRAAGAPVRPDAGPERDDLGQFGGRLDHHPAIRPVALARCRRTGGPGGDQRRAEPAAGRSADAAGLFQGQSRRRPDPDPCR